MDGILTYINLGMSVFILILSILSVLKSRNAKSAEDDLKNKEILNRLNLLSDKMEAMSRDTDNRHSTLRSEISKGVVDNVSRLGDSLRDQQEKQLNSLTSELGKIKEEFGKIRSDTLEMLEKMQKENSGSMEKFRSESKESLASVESKLEKSRAETADILNKMQSSNAESMDKLIKENKQSLGEVEQKLEKSRADTAEILTKMQSANSEAMEKLRADNQKSLDKINDTVNEKLQKTLNDRISQSFEAVNSRLTEVYRGLGEMKQVAQGVTDLKKVLSNVKTRGIMGEIQLDAILSEILSPEQYGTQVAVDPSSREAVDFAVKLPGSGENNEVWLPIDSKFPGETYANLQAAYESGNSDEIKSRRSLLENEVKRCAKSISEKYINPPVTTDFAIMFLPFEGLYSEVINLGLVERLQRDYKINVAGPSTMSAMLNSLRMGFRTLAIQKKSSEVWRILEEAKKEFGKFSEVLDGVRKKLSQADSDLGKLIGARTKAINRSLANVADGGDELQIAPEEGDAEE
ncbi:MAG: DNA recombination protein RmuC [Firmicutes bacterium]|nr:DNA recombination protein RmuC [[Eubacterium] siraeum]MCM1487721.1 DNA recombination protein RmuC [Bacillota bacterium]